MDQVFPELQFGVDKVETCSWESNSPHAGKSPGDAIYSSAPRAPQHRSSPAKPREPEAYTRGSRECSAEPISPANLQIMQEQEHVVCKEEEQGSDYSCELLDAAGADPSEVRAKPKQEYLEPHPSTSLGAMSAYGNYSQDPTMVTVPPPPPPPPSGPLPPATAAPGNPMMSESGDLCTIPPCMRFGTYLPPEKQDKNIMISLEGAELWHQFYQAGTEMIITKSGRRMFPGIVISIGGLNPELKYSIALEFNPVDNARYKYINTKWVNIGKAEAHCEEMLKYVHPESPSTGKHWMSSKISFKKIKVTNNKNHKKGVVVALNSMHKYQPRVVISRFISKKNQEPIFVHDLVECTFIGVTAYQNDQVTQLKIDHNPFAKAFRENATDNDSYGYGVMASWSPLLSPYGASASFSPEGQALPMLSPSCIPPAGPSPLPQFNSAFCSWESPPYSPATAAATAYRSPFQNPGALPSPTLIPDHRQVLSSRLMAQDSPPISPLLYQPGGTFPASHPQLHPPPSSAIHQFSSVAQQKPPEIWIQKSDYTSSASAATTAFEVSTAPVGYGVHTTMKASATAIIPTTHQQPVVQHHQVIQTAQSQTGGAFAVPKVEQQAHSPAEIMDVQP